MRTPKATHANFEGTQRGYAVTIKAGDKKLAYAHFNIEGGLTDRSAKIDAAYAKAKKFAYSYGVA